MTDPKEFQQERREWSRWKHAILEGYLERFSGILQRYETIYVVDGFAGPGIYRDGEEGSPLLAAKLARSTEERWYKLRCINVEKEPEVFRNLSSSTTEFEQYVTNLEGAFGDYVSSILDLIGDKPVLFFLDPMGLKGLEWEDLQPILQRQPAITEILVRYDVSIACRLRGFIGESDAKQRDANIRNLMDVFGFSMENELIDYLGQYPGDTDGITQAYQDRLRRAFDYVVKIPIRKREGQLKYYLLFATRNLKGVVAMNDTCFEVEGMRDEDLLSWRQEENRPRQLDMFEPLPESRLLNDLETVKQEVLSEIPMGYNRRRDDLRAKIALKKDYFGAFSGSYFTAVLGGQPRTIKVPKSFVPLGREQIVLQGAPGEDGTTIRRV